LRHRKVETSAEMVISIYIDLRNIHVSSPERSRRG